jgi:cytoskeletal protein CcmA (bactofilin family)
MENESGSRQTVIEEGTGFKGDFNSDCPIVVKGRIEGQMTAPSLTVDATGSVSGTVKVKELRSEGVIAGEYDADYVKLSGAVKDNTIIRAKTLEVHLSPPSGRMQITFGQCELEVGDVPDKGAVIAAAEGGGAEPAPSEPEPFASTGTDTFAAASAGGRTDPPPAVEPPAEAAPVAEAASAEAPPLEPTTEGKRRRDRRNSVPPEAR